jgi:hypothetical protein
MRSMRSLLPLIALSLAVLAGAAAPPCSGAPLQWKTRRPMLATGAPGATRNAPGAFPEAGPATPPFQVVGVGGDLAVMNATNLLTAAVFIQPDSAFSNVFFVTGLARSPGGTMYVVGNDLSSNSWLGTVDFTTGVETTVGEITGYVINDIAFDGAGNLYGLTDNTLGASPHSLLHVNPSTAAFSVAKTLNDHGGSNDFAEGGAIGYNPADGNLYYVDRDASHHLFVDRLASGTFTQTTVLSSTRTDVPFAIAFNQGKLWLFSLAVLSVDASNFAADFTVAGIASFPTPDGLFLFSPDGAVPSALPCVPSTTAACLYNRFKVEITYDATPNNGTGPANVVLESTASVKFTFFDPTVIEMILKVLNACTPPFNKWWVFAGGLTNVGVAIKVTDTVTGKFQRYNSAKGQLFQTFADTSAFPCP